MALTTSFKDIHKNTEDVLQTGYVHKYFSTFSFMNRQQNPFRITANLSQLIENNGTTQVSTSGLVTLVYQKPDLIFKKTIDINRSLAMRIDKKLHQGFAKGHTVFGKFLSESTTLADRTINPCLGFYNNLDNFSYQAKMNLETLIAEMKGKAVYLKNETDKEEYGIGVGSSFDFKQNHIEQAKVLMFYKNFLTTMSLQLKTKRSAMKLEESTSLEQPYQGEMQQTVLYSLHQRLDDNLNIAIQLRHDSKQKQFGMILGGKYTNLQKVICRAKIDDKFALNTSFQLALSDALTFTISNHIDLNLRNKKDPVSSSGSTFPIGFRLDIQQ